MSNVNRRLDDLEEDLERKAIEKDDLLMQEWARFWQGFSDEELQAIASGQADDDLLERAANDLIYPLEVLEIMRDLKKLTGRI